MLKCLMLCAALALAATAYGQCGPGGCSIDEWKELEGDPGRIYLFRHGRQIGGWDYEAGVWRSYDAHADRWGEPTKQPPTTPPMRRVLDYGVDSTKLGHGRCQLNGKPATRREIDAAIGAAVPDDSKKFRLVASGDDEERRRIASAWEPVEPDLKARIALWSVPANHWSLQDTTTGKTVFRTGGLTFLAPDGKVLHRQADFAGPEDFAAIRKAVRAYDADKDPDLRKAAPAPTPGPTPAPVPTPTNLPSCIALIVIAAINYFLHKRGS